VLLEALLIQHKCGHTNNTKHVYNMSNVITMQDIKTIELRDSGSNANTEICFEVRATTLRPRLHTEGFPLCPHRTFHKVTSTKELQLNNWSTQLLSQTHHLYTRGKAQSQSKEKGCKLGDPMITNSLGDHK